MDWISVDDKLPEEDVMVLILLSNGDPTMGRRWEDRILRGWDIDGGGYIGFFDDEKKSRTFVTHWMPVTARAV